MDNRDAVVVKELMVRFRRQTVLPGLSLSVPGGQIVGILGPSGSGKTTLVRSIMGLVPPQAGTISVLGRPVPSFDALRQIGYMAQNDALYDDLTAADPGVLRAHRGPRPRGGPCPRRGAAGFRRPKRRKEEGGALFFGRYAPQAVPRGGAGRSAAAADSGRAYRRHRSGAPPQVLERVCFAQGRRLHHPDHDARDGRGRPV